MRGHAVDVLLGARSDVVEEDFDQAFPCGSAFERTLPIDPVNIAFRRLFHAFDVGPQPVPLLDLLLEFLPISGRALRVAINHLLGAPKLELRLPVLLVQLSLAPTPGGDPLRERHLACDGEDGQRPGSRPMRDSAGSQRYCAVRAASLSTSAAVYAPAVAPMCT